MIGDKVVTAKEMARVEKLSPDSGPEYMERAGQEIAKRVLSYFENPDLITLVVGKGNNGGDAYVAGRYLMEMGCHVQAIALFDEVSPLNCINKEKFLQSGGELTDQLPKKGLLIDAILGTGFSGLVDGAVKEWIDEMNHSELPVICIDVPSALQVKANLTLYLGMAKTACFLDGGMQYTGKLQGCDFGLLHADQAEPFAYLLDEKQLPSLLPPIKRTRHKYEAGYVLALAGSAGMPGAAAMACLAAYRVGAGIVRLFEETGEQLPNEVIRSPWDPELVEKEAKRTSAVLIGPGLGRDEEVGKRVFEMLDICQKPTVIDADGLYHLAQFKGTLTQPVVLTPHRQEMIRLLGQDLKDDLDLIEKSRNFAKKHGFTVVLKGAPTWIFHSDDKPLIMHRGTPALAKAGTGDVLTGVIAGLLAQGLKAIEAAALGTWLHAIAGEKIAMSKSEYSLIATDLLEVLPNILLDIKH